MAVHFPFQCPPGCTRKSIQYPLNSPAGSCAPQATTSDLHPPRIVFDDQPLFFSREIRRKEEQLTAGTLARFIDIARNCIQYHASPNTNQIAWAPVTRPVTPVSPLPDKLTSPQEDTNNNKEAPLLTSAPGPDLRRASDEAHEVTDPPCIAADSFHTQVPNEVPSNSTPGCSSPSTQSPGVTIDVQGESNHTPGCTQ